MKKVPPTVRFGFSEERRILGVVPPSSVTVPAPYRHHLMESAAPYRFQRPTVPLSSAHRDHRSHLAEQVAGLQLEHKYMAELLFLGAMQGSRAFEIQDLRHRCIDHESGSHGRKVDGERQGRGGRPAPNPIVSIGAGSCHRPASLAPDTSAYLRSCGAPCVLNGLVNSRRRTMGQFVGGTVA
jgi:hypothetical protein